MWEQNSALQTSHASQPEIDNIRRDQDVVKSRKNVSQHQHFHNQIHNGTRQLARYVSKRSDTLSFKVFNPTSAPLPSSTNDPYGSVACRFTGRSSSLTSVEYRIKEILDFRVKQVLLPSFRRIWHTGFQVPSCGLLWLNTVGAVLSRFSADSWRAELFVPLDLLSTERFIFFDKYYTWKSWSGLFMLKYLVNSILVYVYQPTAVKLT